MTPEELKTFYQSLSDAECDVLRASIAAKLSPDESTYMRGVLTEQVDHTARVAVVVAAVAFGLGFALGAVLL